MAKKSTTAKLKVPGVLAFERKLAPSDARMYSTIWQQRYEHDAVGLGLVEKSVRGTISNRLKSGKGSDPAKIDAGMKSPNLQTVDACNLPEEHDTLVVRFSLKVHSDLGVPTACNSAEFRDSLVKQVKRYLDENQATVLGRRYAMNLANGRFLWRNRVGAEAVEVTVSVLAGAEAKSWTFNAMELPLDQLDAEDAGIDELGELISKTLGGEQDYLLLQVTAMVKTGSAQEVFPSQEIVQDAPSGKGGKSKFLYSVGGVAAMHSQKIGNAIRTIDTWYHEDATRPIAVEAYGAVTTEGKAYRDGSSSPHFYKLFDRWSVGEEIEPEQEHYVMAMLVRGGVFGQSEKEAS
ncbi:type I-F CRISPR-associated protein Csy3 [Roseiconus lacunae]|uniref:type I-F CRISPR-associated protein Csy3 n=1 Tax=Roseiconus lacunae TaxID=2605694 RepID=UPI001E513C82|nr:type I-F CRISPR-associated protein Csy3 [Roseiconus lacunae]MCD0461982.1 type I-F CRISPR-associated protein Csy3 [Roseiconus lacunae]